MIQSHKTPRPDIVRPNPVHAKIASQQRMSECGYLIARYHTPSDRAEKIISGLSIASRTLLAMEMAERERATYVSDYDPFREL